MENDPSKHTTPQSNEKNTPQTPNTDEHGLPEPILAYTANGNLEAHSVVEWLESQGVRSHAVEDNSGVGLFAFGTISQFHKPQVFVNKSDAHRAGELLFQFESRRHQRRSELNDAPPILSTCEECGVTSEFPASQNGTTQNCPKCHAFMDVGSFDWPDDFNFDVTEVEVESPVDADDALDAAAKLDKIGDWDAAIAAYRDIANRWPAHTTYAGNCIADVQRKLDAAQ